MAALIWLESKVFGWFSMTGHATAELGALHYPGDRRKLADWGITLARDNHIDLTPFWGVLVVYNFQTDSGSARRTSRGSRQPRKGLEPHIQLS